MSWVGRAFGRAVIYNVVRDQFYQAHRWQQAPRRPQFGLPLSDMEVQVNFVCPQGHAWTIGFTDPQRPTQQDLLIQDCGDCGQPLQWKSIDYHFERRA